MAGRFIENIQRAREASEASPKTDKELDAELERAREELRQAKARELAAIRDEASGKARRPNPFKPGRPRYR